MSSHVPREQRTVLRRRGLPVSTGPRSERGAVPPMAGDGAAVRPSARTSQLRLWPMSAAVSLYVASVAPLIGVEPRSQR